jgi:hypothetical protein
MVDVSEEEIMDRSIPVPSELVPGDAIPPVALYRDHGLGRRNIGNKGEYRMSNTYIKSTIREIRQFS